MSDAKTLKTPKVSKPRVLDPQIAALRQEHAQRVAALNTERRSAVLLETVLTKTLPQLTTRDIVSLRAALNAKLGPAPVARPSTPPAPLPAPPLVPPPAPALAPAFRKA